MGKGDIKSEIFPCDHSSSIFFKEHLRVIDKMRSFDHFLLIVNTYNKMSLYHAIGCKLTFYPSWVVRVSLANDFHINRMSYVTNDIVLILELFAYLVVQGHPQGEHDCI